MYLAQFYKWQNTKHDVDIYFIVSKDVFLPQDKRLISITSMILKVSQHKTHCRYTVYCIVAKNVHLPQDKSLISRTSMILKVS